MRGSHAALAALFVLTCFGCVKDSAPEPVNTTAIAPIITRSKDTLGCSRGNCVPGWHGECHQVIVQFDVEGRLNYDVNPLCGSNLSPEQVVEQFNKTDCPDLQEFIAKKNNDVYAYAFYPDGRCWPAFRAVKVD